jgi:HEAT repeat protein
MKMKQKNQLLLGAGLALGLIIFVGVAVAIYSFKDTRLRWSYVDGFWIDNPVWELRQAVASGNPVTISRAFSDAEGSQAWKMKEAIPTMQSYLSNTNPFVRYVAAEKLYLFGDQSGYSTLLALVQSPAPVITDGQDIRIDAATTLAKYRQTDATEAIFALYQQTKNGELIEALQKLAPDQVGKLIPPKEYYSDPLAIRDYGLENDRQFLPQITASFQNSSKPDVKAAAAYALATMTGDQAAIDYLLQQSKIGLSGSDQSHYVDEKAIVSYLGTIHTLAAKKALEEALECKDPDPSVARIAAANLVFNQGGSSEVNQMVVGELTGSLNPLGTDLALNLGYQLIDDPQIQAAGEKFSKYDVTGDWQIYTGDRKNWPIYNWIDNYVINLNPQSPVHP